MGLFGIFVAGFLGTALLSVAVNSQAAPNGGTAASNNLGGLFSVAQRGLAMLIDPSEPAIPDLRTTSISGSPVKVPSSAGSSPPSYIPPSHNAVPHSGATITTRAQALAVLANHASTTAERQAAADFLYATGGAAPPSYIPPTHNTVPNSGATITTRAQALAVLANPASTTAEKRAADAFLYATTGA